MKELGIDISRHRSKSVDEFAGRYFDYVMTVCDNAKEPSFAGSVMRFAVTYAIFLQNRNRLTESFAEHVLVWPASSTAAG